MKIEAAVLRRRGAAYPYAKSRPLAIETIDLDPPGRGEALVRIAAAGRTGPARCWAARQGWATGTA
ncbi:hypothetical protein [Sphingomonas sp. CFBP 8760]|uniref:hypothetical protein n=1 Tax=Sphingomonas sp. CFBP 8760 TaxID=2775282 RepID=UPI001FCEFF21|nr:hypothetical protein [Sphingomonas sp. CFBP 8760]